MENEERVMQKIIQTRLTVGLSAPVKLLQITDVHIDEFAPEDPDEQKKFVPRRRDVFRKEGNFPPLSPNQYLEEAFCIAEKEGALPILTGDVIDLNMIGNWNEFDRITAGRDFMYCPGGHEFQRRFFRYAAEPEPYYETVRKELPAAHPHLTFGVDQREVNGINLLAVDNSPDFFPEFVAEEIAKQVARGLPTVLFMHDPLHGSAITRAKELPFCPPRTEEQERINRDTVELLSTAPNVVGVFSGHNHCEGELLLPNGATSYITPGLYAGICRMIEIV